MKRMKKVLIYFLVMVLAFSYMPSWMGNGAYGGTNISKVSAATEGQLVQQGTISGTNISWKLTVDSMEGWDLTQTPYKLELTGSGDIPNYSNVANTPWYRYAGYIKTLSIGEGITGVGQYAFAYFSSLKTLTLPDSVAYIAQYGFHACSLLESVICGSSLREIGVMAFSGCHELRSVTLNEGLEKIESSAFSDSYIEQITLPESLLYLGKSVFRNALFTSFHIPANVEVIEGNPIVMARKVTQITVDERNMKFKVLDDILYEMDGETPYRAVALPAQCWKSTLVIPEGTQIIADSAFWEGGVSSVSFPDTLIRIESLAFYNTYLREVIIPDSVEYLGSSSFGTCYSLTKATIGSGLKEWFNPFYESPIANITISEENPYLASLENVVYSKNGEILYYYPKGKDSTEYHVLDTVTKIANRAFYNIGKLNELYLPAGLTELSDLAIYYNKKLHSIYFSGDAPICQSISSISSNASDLLLYKLKNSTGWDATINGTGVWDKFTLLNWWPDNLLVEEGTVGEVNWKYEASIGRVTFSGTGNVPDYSKDDLIPWEPYMSQIQTIDVEEGVTGIGANAFANAPMLVRLRTESDFSYIGDSAFAEDNALKFAQINSAKRIGEEAFFGASELQDALYFYYLEEIGAGAFKGCAKIPYVTFGGKLKVISGEAFADCVGIQTCILPETLEALEAGAFRGCTSLRTINIPKNVTLIEENAFADTTALEKVYFYGGIPTTWSQEAFANHSDDLTIYYRKAQTDWETLEGAWNGISVVGLDKFYTERNSHYSFANTASSFGYSDTYRIPRQRYVDILDITKGSYHYSLNKKWGGSCFGMTSTTLEFYENSEFVVQNYDPNANTVYEIAAPGAEEAELTKLIETYQISQHLSAVGGIDGGIVSNYLVYNRLIKRIEEFERSGGMSVDSEADPIIMTILSMWGGHAVIPVSVEQTVQGDYMIKIYDPNYPHQFQNAYVSRDMQKFSYLWYDRASYVDYSTLHEAIENVELDMTAQDESLYISVNSINGTVQTTEGESIDKIEGAFEQVPLNGGMEEAEFCGVRSYVLPKGSYQIVQEEGEDVDTVSDSGEEEEERVFYVASDDVYVEVETPDKAAVLNIAETSAEDGTIAMEVVTEQEDAGQEQATITYNVMNNVGMERTIEVAGGAAEVTVSKESGIQIKTNEEEETQILIDGQPVSVEEGEKEITFEASADENPWKVEDVETENIVVNDSYILTGTAAASVILNRLEGKEGSVVATLLDKDGEVVATSEEIQQTFTTGLNSVLLNFDACELAEKFTEMTGSLELTCKITVSDAEGETSFNVSEEISVILPEIPSEPGDNSGSTPGTEGDNTEGDNTGDDNTGDDNTGDDNTGDDNTGNDNTGSTPEPETGGTGNNSSGTNDEKEDFELKIKETKITLEKGETYQLKPYFEPKKSNETFTYKPSNGNVTVTSKGKITAKKVGSSKVTITSTSGKKVTVSVVVKRASVLKVNKTKVTLEKGETFQLKPYFAPKKSNETFTYKPSNKNITVTSKGKITAKKVGSSKVTIKSKSGKKVTVSVTVKKASVLKVKETKITLGKGETYQLKPYFVPKKSKQTFTYKPSNKNVTVSSKGKITAKKVGSSKVTIKSKNGKKVTVKVTVKKAPSKITLNTTTKTLKVGKKYKIKVTLPKNTASKKITFKSSKKSVAKVSDTGVVTAVKKGTATITVKTFNKKTAKIKIVVK